jgi:hypothetical protein
MTNKPETTTMLLAHAQSLYAEAETVKHMEDFFKVNDRQKELKELVVSALESGAFTGDALRELRITGGLLESVYYTAQDNVLKSLEKEKNR